MPTLFFSQISPGARAAAGEHFLFSDRRCRCAPRGSASEESGVMCRETAGIRSGFTLVEVLVVTVILGILIALVSAAVFPALQSAKEFAITSEASQMDMAMESLKSYYGTGNPPADLQDPEQDTSEIYKFVSRTFPLYTISNGELKTDLEAEGVDVTNFDPGQALVFWLVGFHDDSAAPFSGHAERMNGSKMTSPFYDFDTDRLGIDSSTGTVRYFPKLAGDDYANAPPQRAFLYFDKRAYGTAHSGFSAYQKSTGTNLFYNPQGFQIINAGLDGQLGAGGSTYTDADADNLTNFSGGTMGDYTDQ
jgi:prepilin-type N-terminal cleavage/methylation domain-containing protein